MASGWLEWLTGASIALGRWIGKARSIARRVAIAMVAASMPRNARGSEK